MSATRKFAAIALASGLLGACRPSAPAPEYTVLDGSAEALWSAFSADSGKVRAILLASPT